MVHQAVMQTLIVSLSSHRYFCGLPSWLTTLHSLKSYYKASHRGIDETNSNLDGEVSAFESIMMYVVCSMRIRIVK